MRIIRYKAGEGVRLAFVTEDVSVYPSPFSGFCDLIQYCRETGITPASLGERTVSAMPRLNRPLADLDLLVPVEAPEIWAAGVTYERSRTARNFEAAGSQTGDETFYDKVYYAERPELFFKSTSYRVVHPNEEVCIRNDSKWQIPESELGLVLDREGNIVGYTIGNDMSCRDIEGENPLYLPQAKIWHRSCSVGPAVRLAETVEDPYKLDIVCRIFRKGRKVVEGSANTGQLKRKYDELVSYLARDNELYDGTVLLTGTCIVPPDDFTLQEGDRIEIEVPGIGCLVNPVRLASDSVKTGEV